MKQAATRELFVYWDALRGSRAAPERAEIDPAAIRNVLADTFILEVDADHDFPFRVAGTRINALFVAEQRGRSFLDLWMARDRRSLSALLLTVVDGACPIVAGAAAPVEGDDELELELLLLPLRNYGKTHARILGLMTPARPPTWLGLRALQPLDLRTLRVVGRDTVDTLPRPDERITSAPPQARSLRVIKGGRDDGEAPALPDGLVPFSHSADWLGE